MSSDNPHQVEPGQIWLDCDPRYGGESGPRRFVEVESVDSTHATVRSVRYHITQARKTSTEYGVRTRIRLDRFTPTTHGYKRIS